MRFCRLGTKVARIPAADGTPIGEWRLGPLWLVPTHWYPDSAGPEAITLRNRLIAMGYMPLPRIQIMAQNCRMRSMLFRPRSRSRSRNVSPGQLLRGILVAMEREQWLNRDHETRHILENLTDFHVKIMDQDRARFQTRSVISKNHIDRHSPEFSDVMEYLPITRADSRQANVTR
ncbi:MAG: hypothetical protein GDA36_04065 [Rhodobacteraceae bacterium]|nr:hypothetical protein [Paracoccaceae bacterium]